MASFFRNFFRNRALINSVRPKGVRLGKCYVTSSVGGNPILQIDAKRWHRLTDDQRGTIEKKSGERHITLDIIDFKFK